MSWETGFEDLMPDVVVRRPYTGQDKYSAPSFGAAQDVQCRVVRKPTILRRTGTGEATGTVREVVSSATVYCAGYVGWAMRDQITLPDGSQPVILDLRGYPDEDGDHHEVVLV